MTGDVADSLEVYGQPLFPKEELLPYFRRAQTAADLAPLLRREDNFTAVYERAGHVWIVNSTYALNLHFYSETNGRFLHADTLYSLAQKGAADLAWDYEALADLIGVGHLVGEESLLRRAQTVPLGSVLHWDGKRLTIEKFRAADFAEPIERRDIQNVLVDLFVRGVQEGVGDKPCLLTASAGLDSRVNLAAALHLGMKPELSVMGGDDTKDVQVVKAMAAAFGLPVKHIVLQPQDYLDLAEEVSRATNGIKPLEHWHTLVFAHRAGYRPDDRVLTGTNGEHVRAVGFDYGVLAHALDHLSRHDRRIVTGRLLSKYWQRRTQRLLRDDELRECTPELRDYFGSPRQNDKLMSVMPDRSFVWQSDAFVLEQRRREFQSAGLKLYGLRFKPYSAFLRKSWIDAGWKLDLSWRLGSRWHRYAVERLFPKLLDFAEEKEADRMLRRQRPLLWVPKLNKLYRRPKPIPYMDYGTFLQRPDMLSLLRDNASTLEDWIPQRVVSAIVDEQMKTGKRGRLTAMLTGIAVWRATMRRATRQGAEVPARP